MRFPIYATGSTILIIFAPIKYTEEMGTDCCTRRETHKSDSHCVTPGCDNTADYSVRCDDSNKALNSFIMACKKREQVCSS